jgi:hypothetical protein
MRGVTAGRTAAGARAGAGAMTRAAEPLPAPLRARLYERGIRALPHTILALGVGGALLLVAWQEPALSALSIAWLVRPALAHRLVERLGERLRGRVEAAERRVTEGEKSPQR